MPLCTDPLSIPNRSPTLPLLLSIISIRQHPVEAVKGVAQVVFLSFLVHHHSLCRVVRQGCAADGRSVCTIL